MKRSHFLLSLLCGLLLLSACEQTVFVDKDGEFKPKISVWSDIKTDSLAKITLTDTRRIYGYTQGTNRLKFIAGVQVTISGDGYTDLLTEKVIRDSTYEYNGQGTVGIIYFDRTYYEGHYPIKTNTEYTLSAAKDERSISSTMTIPRADARFISTQMVEGEFGQKDLQIIFKDDPAGKNFYRLDYVYTFSRTEQRYDPATNTYYDTTYAVTQKQYETFDDSQGGNGEEFSFNAFIPYDGGIDTFYYSLTLEAINKEMGEYLRSAQNNNSDPFTEPSILKSNIKGGVGIFSGSTIADRKDFTLIITE